MITGVLTYSYLIGAISTVANELDKSFIVINQKLNVLMEICDEFDIDHNLYLKIKRAIKYSDVE